MIRIRIDDRVRTGQGNKAGASFGLSVTEHDHRKHVGLLTACGRFRRDKSGASAVEFAVLAPVFLLLLIGMICYGLLFATSHGVAQLAADAARAAVAGLSDQERKDIAESHVRSRAKNYLLMQPEGIDVAAAADPEDANQFVVSIRYDSSGLPIWTFAGLLPLPDPIIERMASIKRGGF